MNGNQGNPIFDMFGGVKNFNDQFNAFKNSMQNAAGPNNLATYAENQIRTGLQNGTITQEQFNTLAQMANSILGSC